MTIRSRTMVVTRALVVVAAACSGWLLYHGAAWIVHHDSVNYWMRDRGFVFISNAAEITFSLGPAPAAGAGLILALPLLLGCVRRVGRFWTLVALHALVWFTLVCGLGSITLLSNLGFFGVSVLLWLLAGVWAVICPPEVAEIRDSQGCSSASGLGNSELTAGPPSAT